MLLTTIAVSHSLAQDGKGSQPKLCALIIGDPAYADPHAWSGIYDTLRLEVEETYHIPVRESGVGLRALGYPDTVQRRSPPHIQVNPRISAPRKVIGVSHEMVHIANDEAFLMDVNPQTRFQIILFESEGILDPHLPLAYHKKFRVDERLAHQDTFDLASAAEFFSIHTGAPPALSFEANVTIFREVTHRLLVRGLAEVQRLASTGEKVNFKVVRWGPEAKSLYAMKIPIPGENPFVVNLPLKWDGKSELNIRLSEIVVAMEESLAEADKALRQTP